MTATSYSCKTGGNDEVLKKAIVPLVYCLAFIRSKDAIPNVIQIFILSPLVCDEALLATHIHVLLITVMSVLTLQR